MSKIRTRIAPSPTGSLHIGTARTALFNYLFARKNKGSFVIRIEDTDLERSDKKFEKNILEGLAWLGLETDESPVREGKFGPYRQSERTTIYKKYLEELLKKGAAFYCFHSEKELAEERDMLMRTKKPPIHFCEYRNMGPEEAEVIKEAKGDYLIRFKNRAGKKIVFNDLIRGELVFDSDVIGDFSIAKRLDVPLYNFAVVVDDETMEINHVIRGEDHIPNTPKQLLLIEALGFSTPKYAHLPLILGKDRSKLSKRHGATSVDDYKEMGYLPETIFNFMALLGWSPGQDKEIMSREEIIELFSLERVQKSGAVFDIDKLDWLNGEYIRKKSVKELVSACKPFLEKLKIEEKVSKKFLEKVVALEQPRMKKLSDISEIRYFLEEPEPDMEILKWKEMTPKETKESLQKTISLLELAKTEEEIKDRLMEEATKIGDRGKLLWPLRAALSGKKASAGPFEIIEVLGRENTLKRLKTVLEKISS